jgi:hypothetical protein
MIIFCFLLFFVNLANATQFHLPQTDTEKKLHNIITLHSLVETADQDFMIKAKHLSETEKYSPDYCIGYFDNIKRPENISFCRELFTDNLLKDGTKKTKLYIENCIKENKNNLPKDKIVEHCQPSGYCMISHNVEHDIEFFSYFTIKQTSNTAHIQYTYDYFTGTAEPVEFILIKQDNHWKINSILCKKNDETKYSINYDK